MTNRIKPAGKPNCYRFVLSEDAWDDILEIYRRGIKRRVATIYYGDSDELATQLSALLAKTPDLLSSCNQLAAHLIAELKFGDPEEIRFRVRFNNRLIQGLKQAIVETVRRAA